MLLIVLLTILVVWVRFVFSVSLGAGTYISTITTAPTANPPLRVPTGGSKENWKCFNYYTVILFFETFLCSYSMGYSCIVNKWLPFGFIADKTAKAAFLF